MTQFSNIVIICLITSIVTISAGVYYLTLYSKDHSIDCIINALNNDEVPKYISYSQLFDKQSICGKGETYEQVERPL